MPQISGQVRIDDEKNHVIVGAIVRFKGQRLQGNAEVKTGANGIYKTPVLESGVYDWTALKVGYVTKTGTTILQATDKVLDIVLPPVSQPGTLTGQVLDETAAGVPGASVTATDAQGKNYGPSPTTDKGVYSIEGLPPGKYLVSVAPPADFQPPAPAPVEIAAGEKSVLNFKLARVIRTGTLTGQVLDETAAGVPGASITATDAQGKNYGPSPTTDKGVYSIGGLPPGKYIVNVAPPADFQPPAPAPVEIAADKKTELNFKLARVIRTGTLTGQVLDETAAGVPGANITASDQQGVAHGPSQTTGNGSYGIGDLPPGQYLVSVAPPAGFQPLEPVQVKITAGARTVQNFELAHLVITGAISGRVINQAGDALSAVLVKAALIPRLLNVRQSLGQAITDALGHYIISDLTPGGYTVTVQAPLGYQPSPARQVAVEAGNETRGIDFSLIAVEPPHSTGSITGRVTVFHQGSGLIGLDGTTVAACDAQLKSIKTAQTENDGHYAIAELDPGTYSVKVETAQPRFLPACNVTVIAPLTTAGIDFSEDVIKDFLDRLDDTRFNLESLISEEEAAQAVSFFSVVNLLLAGLSLRQVGDRVRLDILGILQLYFGLQEGSLRDRFAFGNSSALWQDLESELKDLAKELDRLQSDVEFLYSEARRQFNLGLSNNVPGNGQFPALFRRYVEIGNDPLLSFDIKAADNSPYFDKTKIAQADDLLKELKGLILQLVRSLSKYGTAATRRVNEDWAQFEARSLEVLQTVARDRVTPDRDEQNSWVVLADLINKNRDTEVAPYVVLARHGGKLLKYALEIYRETQNELDNFDPRYLRNLFQPGDVLREFWTERIKAEAIVIKRYPLDNWR